MAASRIETHTVDWGSRPQSGNQTAFNAGHAREIEELWAHKSAVSLTSSAPSAWATLSTSTIPPAYYGIRRTRHSRDTTAADVSSPRTVLAKNEKYVWSSSSCTDASAPPNPTSTSAPVMESLTTGPSSALRCRTKASFMPYKVAV